MGEDKDPCMTKPDPDETPEMFEELSNGKGKDE